MIEESYSKLCSLSTFMHACKERLGHKNIQNTLVYIHLEAAIFKSGNDEFTVRTAGTVEEAKQLLEVGFEYVTKMESVKLFRKRK